MGKNVVLQVDSLNVNKWHWLAPYLVRNNK